MAHCLKLDAAETPKAASRNGINAAGEPITGSHWLSPRAPRLLIGCGGLSLTLMSSELQLLHLSRVNESRSSVVYVVKQENMRERVCAGFFCGSVE